MTFKTTIEITPDDDGVHCGECHFVDGEWFICRAFTELPYRHGELMDDHPELAFTYDDNTGECGRARCPACLAAETAAKEAKP
jgi:hypothetical protein